MIVDYNIDRSILELNINETTEEELEILDQTLTHLMNIVRKQIEGPLRRIPFSKTKIQIQYLYFYMCSFHYY